MYSKLFLNFEIILKLIWVLESVNMKYQIKIHLALEKITNIIKIFLYKWRKFWYAVVLIWFQILIYKKNKKNH